jgi:hypothetical protein
MYGIYSEKKDERKLIPSKNQMESNVSYEKQKKLFIEFFFPRFIFQSRVRNFFAISCVIEGAYYIANYKRRQRASARHKREKTQKNSINIFAQRTKNDERKDDGSRFISPNTHH